KRSIARTTLMIVSVGAILAGMAAPALAQRFPGVGTVMTYNVNEGTDFLQVVGAQNLQQFLLGVGQIITQVQGTNPPERMHAVAGKILEVQPELGEEGAGEEGTVRPDRGRGGTLPPQYKVLEKLPGARGRGGGKF